MTAQQTEKPLDILRQEIDSIDDELVRLLIRRFDATDRVRASKVNDGSLKSSPLRPAREAAMLRRLTLESRGRLSPDLVVGLWRVILSASIQAQAPMTLHMNMQDEHDVAVRMIVARHFPGLRVSFHDGVAQVLASLQERRGDLAILPTASGWGDGLAGSGIDLPPVVSTLPVIAGNTVPEALVFGYADSQPSGDDETLLVMARDAPLPQALLWQAHAGAFTIVGLPGFLTEEDDRLRTYMAQNSEARIVGRCPRPMRIEHGKLQT